MGAKQSDMKKRLRRNSVKAEQDCGSRGNRGKLRRSQCGQTNRKREEKAD